MRTALDYLGAIHKLLSKPARFCRTTLAMSKNGNDVNPQSPAACSWCFEGAYAKVTKCQTSSAYYLRGRDIEKLSPAKRRAWNLLKSAAASIFKTDSLYDVNDSWGREAVLQVIVQAKKIARRGR